MWPLSCCVRWRGVTEVIWLLHYVTYLRMYWLHLQQPSLCPFLPFCCHRDLSSLWQMHLRVLFCLIVSRIIYRYIFKIANIVVGEWWPLQPFPYHIGFRDGIKSVIEREKTVQPCALGWCWGLGLWAWDACVSSVPTSWVTHAFLSLFLQVSPVVCFHCLLFVLSDFLFSFTPDFL